MPSMPSCTHKLALKRPSASVIDPWTAFLVHLEEYRIRRRRSGAHTGSSTAIVRMFSKAVATDTRCQTRQSWRKLASTTFRDGGWSRTPPSRLVVIELPGVQQSSLTCGSRLAEAQMVIVRAHLPTPLAVNLPSTTPRQRSSRLQKSSPSMQDCLPASSRLDRSRQRSS